MTDLLAFRKLFKIPIPVDEHVHYYINTLAKSEEFAHLPALLDEFKEFEARCPVSPKRTRQETMERLVHHLEALPTYQEMQNYPLPSTVPTCDRRNHFADGRWLISFDLVAANFTILKSFGSDLTTWEDLCTQLDVDPLLTKSKSFRQIVFGHLNPKRSQRFQAVEIDRIWRAFDKPEFELVFKQHDELVITSEEVPIEELVSLARRVCHRDVMLPVRRTLHKKEHLEGKNQYIVTKYDPDTLEPTQTSLFGIQGNRYMIEFKKHIIKEPLDDRDKLFMSDGKLAMWLE